MGTDEISVQNFALKKFREFAAASNAEEARISLFSNPVLFSANFWPEFQKSVGQFGAEAKMDAMHALSFLEHAEGAILGRKVPYPSGLGPLERIIRSAELGEITEQYAVERASASHIFLNLSALYIAAVSGRHQSIANSGRCREALLGQEILLAAVDARRSLRAPEQDVIEAISAIDYAIIVARVIWECADGKLFSSAVRRAEPLVNVNTAPWRESGEVEFALGSLHQDPYVFSRTQINFLPQIEEWRHAPLDQLGATFGKLDAEAMLVPQALTALTASSNYFLASASKRKGIARGFSLKGYIAAEFWKTVAGGIVSSDLSLAAQEAKELLADERFTAIRAEIDTIVNGLGLKRDPDASSVGWITVAQEYLRADFLEMTAKRGSIETINTVLQVASAVAIGSADRALELWQKLMPVVLDAGEKIRWGYFHVGLRYMDEVLAYKDTDRLLSLRPIAASAKCRSLAEGERWSSLKLAATLLSIAANSHHGNQELEGLQVMQMIQSTDESFAKTFAPVIIWLQAVLYRGAASNAFKARRYGEAIENYSLSAYQFLLQRMPNAATEVLELGVDIVNRKPKRLIDFIRFFNRVLPDIQLQGGFSAMRRVQELCRSWLPLLIRRGNLDLENAVMLLNSVKGAVLSRELSAGVTRDWLASESSKSLLSRISGLRSQLGTAATNASGTLTNEVLLTLYDQDQEGAAGDAPQATLHNLQVRYDTELRRHLFPAMAIRQDGNAPPGNSQLGNGTLLTTFFQGLASGDNAGLYVCFFTEGAADAVVHDLGFGGTKAVTAGVLDALAVAIADARLGINMDPESGALSIKGRAALQTLAQYLLEPLSTMLDSFRRAGKWHLCIQPHGALHFFPFHLLPWRSGTLAHEWTVTYLPSLSLFSRVRAKNNQRRNAIASFGIDFKHRQPHGLRQLYGAEDEARLVASAYGTSAVTGAAATETAVIDAFENAERLHIATHGNQRVSAPSFQSIYLTPEPGKEGILYAHNLLSYDLRGLDLLSLSACETSLARVDIGDNLWGFATNALIAGSDTVIGTLWPVEDSAAQTFFHALHTKLASGTNKLRAFKNAQETTIRLHPEFRDWGAFYYSGLW